MNLMFNKYKKRISIVLLTVFMFSIATPLITKDHAVSGKQDEKPTAIEMNISKFKDISDIRIDAANFSSYEGEEISVGAYLDENSTLIWKSEKGSVEYVVDIPYEGNYEIWIEYSAFKSTSGNIERIISVNGNNPYEKNPYFILPRKFADVEYPFRTDEFGNDLRSKQEEIFEWKEIPVLHPLGYESKPLTFYFNKGMNKIKLSGRMGSLAINKIVIRQAHEIPRYEIYKSLHDHKRTKNVLLSFESENIYSKSSKSIQPVFTAEAGVTPEAIGVTKLNSMGGTRWRFPGDWAKWSFNVPESGMYNIAFRYKQNMNQNLSVFRTVYINGEVPFEELYNVEFPYSVRWENLVLGSEINPFEIYLEKGKNTVTLQITSEPYKDIILNLENFTKELRELDFFIKEITGVDATDKVDRFKIWNLENYIPDLSQKLLSYSDTLSGINDELKVMMKTNRDIFSVLASNAKDLQRYAEDTERIPQNPDSLANIQMTISTWIDNLKYQPLMLDKYYVVSTDQHIPSAKVKFLENISYTLRNFFSTFSTESMVSSRMGEDVLQVWVQRNRDYVNLLQEHVDLYFSPDSGIKVNINYIPSQNVLILANAAGEQPDIGSGLTDNTIFEFSLRNAVIDLNRFPEYEDMIQGVIPGSLRPYHFNQKDYGFPEEAMFNIMFYRKDIFEQLDIEPPNTWEELLNVIPTLQQYNMNLFYPWGSFDPFLFQSGKDYYSEDGMNVGFSNIEGFDAFKYWTDLYVRYGLPHRAVSFYQHFRQGSMPLGIAPANQYVLFQIAAPDISGLWGIKPIPGFYNESGEIERWQGGAARGAMIFKTNDDREKRAWEFMKWWVSDETQAEFSLDLENYYGVEFRWFPTNIHAFDSIPWMSDDRKAMKEQMKWYKDVPNVPGGSYMMLREIRNAWTRTVIDKGNYREEFDKAIVMINRELERKYTQFGFIETDGEIISKNPILQVSNPIDE